MDRDLAMGAEALEALVAESGDPSATPTERQGLLKALDILGDAFTLLRKGGPPMPPPPHGEGGDEPDGDEDEEKDDDEDEAPKGKGKGKGSKEIDIKIEKSEAAGRAAFFERAIDADPDLPEVADRTATVERLVDTFAKSEGSVRAIYDRLDAQQRQLEAMAAGVAALCKGMGAQMGQFERVAQQPAGNTSPGFILMGGQADETPVGDMPGDLKKSLTAAITNGDVEREYSAFLSRLDTQTPERVWRALPAAVRAKLR